jgi:hypothetical protein
MYYYFITFNKKSIYNQTIYENKSKQINETNKNLMELGLLAIVTVFFFK